ncbi:hypothetical protein ACES2L_11480 [Bdellovibrio bacteriovorus]
MKSLILSLLVFSFSSVGLAQEATVSVAKAAELTAHRIDRLVTLGKIDSSFLTSLETIEVEVLQNQSPAVFKSISTQTAPVAGEPLKLEVLLDGNGKALSYQVSSSGSAGVSKNWPEKDAVSLTENALHYVLENNMDPKVALFDSALSSIVLEKGVLDGVDVAIGKMKSTLTTETLLVYLKLDGSFISAEMVP